MASNKTGLSYYSVDTDRYMDIRIRRLVKDHGCRGLAVYDYLLCEVYRVQGCFVAWDEVTAFNVAEYLGLKESNVFEIVRYCGDVGLFNKELLSRGVITSASIQRRYLEMCNRSKRKIAKIPEECRIIPEESQKTPEVCGKERKERNISSPNVEDIPPQSPFRGEAAVGPSPEGDRPSPERKEKVARKRKELNLSAVGPSPEGDRPSPERKEKVARKRKELNLSAVGPSFQPIVADWLAYKSERGQTYRQRGFDAFYAHLLELSSGDAGRARKIVEQSMANNWAGLFPLKTSNDHERSTKNRTPTPDELACAVAEGWARAHTRQEWE